MDSLVIKKVKWLHKVVVTNQGQPPVYGKMSLPLFINGYLTIVAEESVTCITKAHMLTHLQELMEDSNPGDRACPGFNKGMCTDNTSHPRELHVCSYCLKTVQRLCRHTESTTKGKALIKKTRWGGGGG